MICCSLSLHVDHQLFGLYAFTTAAGHLLHASWSESSGLGMTRDPGGSLVHSIQPLFAHLMWRGCNQLMVSAEVSRHRAFKNSVSFHLVRRSAILSSSALVCAKTARAALLAASYLHDSGQALLAEDVCDQRNKPARALSPSLSDLFCNIHAQAQPALKARGVRAV